MATSYQMSALLHIILTIFVPLDLCSLNTIIYEDSLSVSFDEKCSTAHSEKVKLYYNTYIRLSKYTQCVFRETHERL